jgi:hypothetical protein
MWAGTASIELDDPRRLIGPDIKRLRDSTEPVAMFSHPSGRYLTIIDAQDLRCWIVQAASPRLPSSFTKKARPSRQRRCVDNKSARCLSSKATHKKSEEEIVRGNQTGGAVLQSVKRQREYLGYRSASESAGSASSMPTLIGAAMIAAAILLSTLISALGSRYVGLESPTEESAWLVDRLTGHVYKCHAPQPGRASCEAEIATGSVGERQKR